MRGSHAPSLRTLVARTLRDEIRLAPGSRILCATSGGPDSNAMLHVLALLAGRFDWSLAAHGVDHGLRPEAASELAIAGDLARSLGVPFTASRVDVRPGSNLQARARAVRYEALRTAAVATGATFIATAHTVDDRAETVLLRLLRGSGARGLAVLPARDGDLLRPLIRARRADVERHLERHGVPFSRDPSNLDTRFARVRVRREILPALEALSPNIVHTLASLADELAGLRAGPPEPLATLGRRQREQITLALASGRTGRVRLNDCKELLVTLSPPQTEDKLAGPKPDLAVVASVRRRRGR